MTSLLEPTLEDIIVCISRERAYRTVVYKKLVANGKMTQEKADWEIKCMMAAMNKLLTLDE